MNPERIARVKAPACRAAWHAVCGGDASLECTALLLAHGGHETNNGDSWPGPDGVVDTQDDENNIGATTLRSLTPDEKAVLAKAGIVPTIGPGHNQRAAEAMAALRASGLVLPQGVIHCDSTTDASGRHPYFVWFASFPTLVEGYAYFIRMVCVRKDGSRKAAYTALTRPSPSVYEYAAALYQAGYYWGFHPHDAEGNQKNIDAYADSLRGLYAQCLAALKQFRDTDPAPADVRVEQVTMPDGGVLAASLATTSAELLDEARAEKVARLKDEP